jgi:hypothetical protein
VIPNSFFTGMTNPSPAPESTSDSTPPAYSSPASAAVLAQRLQQPLVLARTARPSLSPAGIIIVIIIICNTTLSIFVMTATNQSHYPLKNNIDHPNIVNISSPHGTRNLTTDDLT